MDWSVNINKSMLITELQHDSIMIITILKITLTTRLSGELVLLT